MHHPIGNKQTIYSAQSHTHERNIILCRLYISPEVSSELKYNTVYFKTLTDHIENVGGRVAFYRYLMARDISGFDWENVNL
jgi:hypothetical protein